jgi:hypothetical protein
MYVLALYFWFGRIYTMIYGSVQYGARRTIQSKKCYTRYMVYKAMPDIDAPARGEPGASALEYISKLCTDSGRKGYLVAPTYTWGTLTSDGN